MANPTWRYHPELAPKGQIFDADAENGLPRAEDGWYDTPYFNHIPREKPFQIAVMGWPDASSYANVDVYMSVMDERMPAVPTEEELRAGGVKDAEKIEETIAGAQDALRDAASSALRHYASTKHAQELDGRYGAEKLLRECRILDEKAS